MIKHILKLIWNKKGSNALMILEILLSFLVLFAGLSYMLYNYDKLKEPLGFETKNRWIVALDDLHSLDSLESVNTINNLKRTLLDQEEIEALSFTSYMAPFSNSMSSNSSDDMGFEIYAYQVYVEPDLKEALNLNITDGRWFQEDDYLSSVEKIIVNQKFIDEFFEGKSMIDSTITFSGELKIIGVIDSYKYLGQFEDMEPTIMYLKDIIECKDFLVLKMKEGTPKSYEEKLSLIVSNTTNRSGSIIEQLDKKRIENGRSQWLMLGSMIFVCTFLCINVALGLFGVLWFNINKRKSEIGLRQALGAHRSNITKQFIIEILILSGFALIIGIFFAIQIPLLKVTEFESQLFYRAIGYASVIIIVLVTICAMFPSFQAAKITPAQSLHED